MRSLPDRANAIISRAINTGKALGSHQITMHTNSLRRWFDPKEARRMATYYVDSGQAWMWPEPVQLELF